MKSNCITIFLTIFYLQCFAQTSANYAGGATVFSLAGITTNHEGIQAVYHNPASCGYFEKSIGFDLSGDRRYVNNFLNSSIGLVKTMGRSRFGLGYVQNGISEFKNSSIFLLYARPLFQNLYLGARANYNQISIEDYGKTNNLSIDIGLHSKVTKSVSVGAFYDAIAASKYNDTYVKETRVVVGFDYHPSNKVNLLLEFEKSETEAMSPKIGIVYKPNASIQFQTGVDIQREVVGFGFRYNIQAFNFTAGQAIHNQLGSIYALSISGQK